MARKILLADDSVTAQNMGRKILADAGYEVITVNNGSAALKRISEHRPDVIVLDVYMPGYSGLEVCQRLKEVPETRRIPVLLTVGKLEPFKPEEARRVKAEGFIVKPFEASELLSALSKLEDKIVPHAEPSKPGRFARAIAAVEQSNRDRVMMTEEDAGWKDRIAFPSKKKKKKDEEESGEDTASYKPVRRDLEETAAAEQSEAAAASKSESAVDATAMAPAELPKDSLPKDVTPEEIAAIAAAAAQVQGAGPASKEISETAVPSVAPETPSAPAKGAVEQREPAEEVPAATFAEHKGDEKHEASEAVAAEKKDDQPGQGATAGEAEVVAPIASIESEIRESWSGPGNGAGYSAEQGQDWPPALPAASAATIAAGPRWTAVAVEMDAAEAAISLEQEMQMAQASLAGPFVVPKIGGEGPALVAREPEPAETAAMIPASGPEIAARAATDEESALAQALSAVANVATEAVTAAVSELAAIAGSHIDSATAAPSAEVTAPGTAAEAWRSPEPSRESTNWTQPAEEAGRRVEESYPASTQTSTAVTPQEDLSGTTNGPQSVVSAAADEAHESAEPVSAHAEAAQAQEPAAGGIPEIAEKKESEGAAPAPSEWASWRQIRSDEPHNGESAKEYRPDDQGSTPAETAAMAVAAGAEKSPEEGAPGADPNAIANIVDSVLADLRPKIVEEIAKKLGKK